MGEKTVNRKHKNQVEPARSENKDGEEEKQLSFTGLLGIVLLAGALFNIPAIMKVPETTADKMMLVIVITMAVGGGILLLFAIRHKKN